MANKKIFLILAIFLFIPLICAKNITTEYPDEAGLQEEFSFKIKLIDFDPDTYDVKIDVVSNSVRVANILDGDTWKSTYYYVTDAIKENKEKEFSLKITKEFEEADITIKIRNSKDEISTFNGYAIKFNPTTASPQTENNN